MIIRQPWLKKMLGKSDNIGQKEDFMLINEPIYPLKIRLFIENNLFLVSLIFPLLFNELLVLIVIYEGAKTGPLKKGF